jgi:SP family myo-inositol transporter-like MFS transporter 13
LLRRKYVVPFLLACVILACNQATGINSIIGYSTTILLQSGLSDVEAHWGSVILTVVNFLVTIAGVALVDRKGRKFLLSLGTAGIVLSLIVVGALFHRTEKRGVDGREAVQAMVTGDTLRLAFNELAAGRLAHATGDAGQALLGAPATIEIIYSYGDFRAATSSVRSDDPAAKPITITREPCVPANRVMAFFSNPFADLEAARTAPLVIESAVLTPLPTPTNGWLTATFIFLFIACFAVGPGVCVWLALSELMPTRIRSNGMSIALLVNQAVSTAIAGTFLPTVGAYGYSTMFWAFAGCTVLYFVTAALFLPQTKGKTLEDIEAKFERRSSAPSARASSRAAARRQNRA